MFGCMFDGMFALFAHACLWYVVSMFAWCVVGLFVCMVLCGCKRKMYFYIDLGHSNEAIYVK